MYNYIKNGKIHESKEHLFYYSWVINDGHTLLADYYTEKEFEAYCEKTNDVSLVEKRPLPYFNQEFYVVENYNHSSNNKYVYRIFKSLSQAVKYVELDIFHLLTVIYGMQDVRNSISLTEGFYDIVDKSYPVRVYVMSDRIEFWMLNRNGSLNYLRNVIRLDSKYFDSVVDTLEKEYAKRYDYKSNK